MTGDCLWWMLGMLMGGSEYPTVFLSQVLSLLLVVMVRLGMNDDR